MVQTRDIAPPTLEATVSLCPLGRVIGRFGDGGRVFRLIATFNEGFHEHSTPSFMNTPPWGVHEMPWPGWPSPNA